MSYHFSNLLEWYKIFFFMYSLLVITLFKKQKKTVMLILKNVTSENEKTQFNVSN